MADAHVNGVRLYYEEHGRGDAILWIHGAASSGLAAQQAVPALSQLGRLVLYDRRGATRSERPDSYDASVPAHAEDAAALLRHVGAGPAVVLGRSYGGEIATALALQHPDLVRALALLDGVPPTLDDEAQAWMEDLRAAAEEAAARDPLSVAEVLFDWVAGPGALASFPEELRQMFVSNSPTILAEVRPPYFAPTDAELARIDVPTLLVVPAEPLPGMIRATARMAAALPNAQTVVVPGGHIVDPTQPAILEFVADVLRG
jgi:pimeloyl-ACP methyl ester carboxylesterase